VADKRADDIKSDSKTADAVLLFVLALAVVFAVAVPAVLAVAAWLMLRERITRRDGTIIAVTALVLFIVAMVIDGGGPVSQYFHWLGVLVTGKGGSRLDIPILPIILLAGVMLGTTSALQGTQVAVWGLKPFKKSQISNSRPSLIPSHRERQRMAVAKPPSEALIIHADTHSVTDENPSGKRTFPLGIGPDRKPVVLGENELGMHTLVFGSTGAGKTVTLEVMAASLLDLGWSGLVLDLKEDTKAGGLRDWCEEYSHSHSLPFQELRLSDPESKFYFNPLEGIGPDEARDTILSLTELQDAYWAAINRKQLGQTCTLFWMAHQVDPVNFPTPSMFEIGKLLSSPDLPAAAKKMSAVVLSALPHQFVREDFGSLLNPSKAEAEAAVGFGARLIGVYSTQAGRSVLRPSSTGYFRQSLDVTQDGLTYIGLDSLGKADLTKMISSSVLQRLSVYASMRTTGGGSRGTPRPRFVIIDEANWVDRMIIQNLLSRARSAGIAIILATQGPKDWDTQGRAGVPGFEALAQNCNVAVIMAQGELANAEICADYIGLAPRQIFSQQVREGGLQDAGSLSEVRDHIVSPDELRELTIGQAIVKVSKPENRVSWVKITPRDASLKARR
jgi:hypothetical protein